MLFSFEAFCQKDFIDDQLPKDQPRLFAPGLISDELGNRDMAIAPQNDELFYTVQYLGGRSFSVIMHAVNTNGRWNKPEVAAFSGQYSDLEPAFSPDGKKLYFVSNRPLNESSKEPKDYDIWVMEKENGRWTAPKNTGAPVNSKEDEFYPSVARSGNIYFTRSMGNNGEDIVVCKKTAEGFDSARSLPPVINSEGGEFNAFVDPDERYIIYTAYKRKGNIGSGDLYISRMSEKKEWSESKNLGALVNGQGLTYCPYVSPDKRFFFFTTSRGIFTTPFENSKKIADLKKQTMEPLNGWDNIFWIDARAILEK